MLIFFGQNVDDFIKKKIIVNWNHGCQIMPNNSPSGFWAAAPKGTKSFREMNFMNFKISEF